MHVLDLKFDDCRSCQFRSRPDVCADCDSGELFEERGRRPLNFSPSVIYQSLTDDDDAGYLNPRRILNGLGDMCDDEMDDR